MRLSSPHRRDIRKVHGRVGCQMGSAEFNRGSYGRYEHGQRRQRNEKRDLYLFGRRTQYVVYTEGNEVPVRVPVHW